MDQILIHQLLYNHISKHQENQTCSMMVPTTLNPNATEFVPQKKRSIGGFDQQHGICTAASQPKLDEPSPFVEDDLEAKSLMEADTASTTTLVRQEMLGVDLTQCDAVYDIQKETLELLSVLGSSEYPLVGMTVSLGLNGYSINIQFTGQETSAAKPGNQVQMRNTNDMANELAALHIDMTNQDKLPSKPSNLLVAQFLHRVSDVISEKMNWHRDSLGGQWSGQNHSETEIERQIEGIKAFEKFFMLNANKPCSDIITHRAFQDLCQKLGISNAGDVAETDYTTQTNKLAVVPPHNEREYVADIESQSTSGEMPEEPRSEYEYEEDVSMPEFSMSSDGYAGDGAYSPSIKSISSKEKFYSYKYPKASKLHVNRLSTEDFIQNWKAPQHRLLAPHTTPTQSMTNTRLMSVKPVKPTVVTISRKHSTKLIKPARLSNGLNGSLRKSSNHNNESLQRGREQQLQVSGARVKSHLRVASSGNSSKLSNRSLKPVAPKKESAMRQSAPLKHTAASYNYAPSNKSGKAKKNPTTQKFVPRNTTTCMMRQTEVKRRMNLLEFGGPQMNNLHYNDYLFK